MTTHRLERIQEELRQAVSNILLFEITDPLVKGVTVTRALVTKDLSLARVYYDLEAKGAERAAVQKGLDRARGFVRRQLASKVSFKTMPQIEFFFDETREEIDRVDELLSKL